MDKDRSYFRNRCEYVPGNIFYLAGYQVIRMFAGAPSSKLLKSMVWEVDLAVVLGHVITALGDVLFFIAAFLIPKNHKNS